jgi:hypothetical protein
MNLCAAVLPIIVAAQSGDAADASMLTELWQESRASGSWRTDYFHSSKGLDDEVGFAGATLQLKALPSINERVDGKIELRATNAAIGSGGATRIQALEAYVRVHFARADLYLGKQIVAWGRADGLNPTDNLTPRDYTVMLPFEDDQRFGTPGARVDLFLMQEHTLTLFASPSFEPARIPLPAELEETKPARSLSNTSVGVKLDKTAEGVDWSVSYYRGFSLLPSVDEATLRYDRITVIGADIARNYGRFGFRGELAYVDTADDAGTDPTVRNPHLYWIAGVDRTFFDDLNLNLQFFQRRTRAHREAETFGEAQARSTAALNAVLQGQQDSVSNGVTFRVSNQWLNDTLEAELFAAINITRDNSFLRPLVTYAFSDDWKGTFGAELYFGGADTQYGSLESNRGIFAELRYGF